MLGWSAVEDLYARYSRSVFRRSRALLGNDDDAREATQGVFRRIIRLGGPLPSEAAPMAWFYRVTTDVCLHKLRKDHGQPSSGAISGAVPVAIAGAVAEHAPLRMAATPRPEGADEGLGGMRGLLDTIPADLQEIAVYFFLDQLSFDEIAAIVGVSNRTVAHRLGEFRALIERAFPDLRRMAS
jgi:RNA polymerase sigma-70 factor (ECF subfamily)